MGRRSTAPGADSSAPEANASGRKRGVMDSMPEPGRPEPTDNEQYPAMPIPTGFRFGGGSREMHGHPIYCVSWSDDLYRRRCGGDGDEGDADGPHPSESSSSAGHTGDSKNDHELVRCLATCGGDHLTVYEVNVKPQGQGESSSSSMLVVRQAYVDADDGEVFYACAFGGRGIDLDALPLDDDDGEEDDESGPSLVGSSSTEVVIDALDAAATKEGNTLSPRERELRYYRRLADFASYDGPQLLCCAGKRGVVKVIDTMRRALVLTLSGHGDEIYDLKFNPSNEWLLATASKDESLRLWNLKTATCVAIFAGENGHRESVLSLDFHPRGTAVASSGMDNTVKLWSLDGEDMRRSIAESFEQRPRRDGERLRRHLEGTDNLVFRTRYVQMPYFSTKKMHTDYVDCVQFVGDLILSKSIANIVVLWKPDIEAVDGREGGRGSGGGGACGSKVIALREFQLNQCSTWFVRFHSDATGRMLAVGNNVGEVKVWEIGTSPNRKHFANLTHVHCGSTIRMVSFSPDGRSLIAVCEDATVWKWDAV